MKSSDDSLASSVTECLYGVFDASNQLFNGGRAQLKAYKRLNGVEVQ